MLPYYPTGVLGRLECVVSSVLRGVLLVVGALIALCSAALLAAAVVEVANGGDGKTGPGTYAALIVLSLGACALGGFLIWQAVKNGPPGVAAVGRGPTSAPATPHASGGDAERERRILQFAETEHGRVTVAEVATHCNGTIAEAKSDLDRLVTQQVAEILVTENGVLVYVFPGFLSDDEKKRAHDF
jgi:hypothetical protein